VITPAPIAIGIQKDLPLGSVDCFPAKRNLAVKRIAVAVARPWAEAGNLLCEPWNVYVALEFDTTENLRDIHIRRIGTCL
jgi:hypothetical protein